MDYIQQHLNFINHLISVRYFIIQYIQMEQIMQFQIGNLYQIICKADELALKLQNPQNHEDSRVLGAKADIQDITQIWLIQRINNDDFQLINALSDNVMDQNKGEIKMKRGSQKSSQLFYIQKAPTQTYYTYYWIKTSKNSNKTLTLEGILRYKQFNVNDQTQLFRFEQVIHNKAINNTTIITNAKSGKAIDVPGGSSQQGLKIIQYRTNKRFNQRWCFIKKGNAYAIKNFKTGLVLDINGESKKVNTRIIQWKHTGANNQLWKIQSRGNGNYTIRSLHEPALVLGIIDDNLNDEGKLAIVSFDALWKLEGYIPPL